MDLMRRIKSEAAQLKERSRRAFGHRQSSQQQLNTEGRSPSFSGPSPSGPTPGTIPSRVYDNSGHGKNANSPRSSQASRTKNAPGTKPGPDKLKELKDGV